MLAQKLARPWAYMTSFVFLNMDVVISNDADDVYCRYGRVNGFHASENRWLLSDVLRKEWGFDGIIMSDW